MLNHILQARLGEVADDVPLRIALRLFDTLERNRFLSLFKIIELENDIGFRLVDCEDANVVIIDPDEPGGERMLDTAEGTSPITVIAYTDSGVDGYRHAIEKPVKLKPLISMLREVAVAGQGKAPGKAAGGAGQALDPDLGLLRILRKQEGGYSKVTLAEVGEFYLDRMWGYYYSPLGDPKRAAAAIGGRFADEAGCRETPLGDDEFQRLITAEALQHHPTQSLIWALAIDHTGESLMRGLDKDRPLQLKQWPNLIRLPHHPEHARLCALMVQHPSTLESAVERTGMERVKVCAFINACALLGMVQYAQGAPEVASKPPQADQARSALLGKIVKRLFG